MQYQTITLQLLEQHKGLHDQLRHTRRLLPTMKTYAAYLKARHELWMQLLRLERPASAPSQLSSEALELAQDDLRSRLRHDSSTDTAAAPSLDEAMAFLRRHTPPK